MEIAAPVANASCYERSALVWRPLMLSMGALCASTILALAILVGYGEVAWPQTPTPAPAGGTTTHAPIKYPDNSYVRLTGGYVPISDKEVLERLNFGSPMRQSLHVESIQRMKMRDLVISGADKPYPLHPVSKSNTIRFDASPERWVVVVHSKIVGRLWTRAGEYTSGEHVDVIDEQTGDLFEGATWGTKDPCKPGGPAPGPEPRPTC